MHETIERTNDLVKTCMAMAQLTADVHFVVAMRVMGMTGAWHVPDSENASMIEEKLPAFVEALMSGAITAMSGRGPDRVMQAVLTPLSEKASANRTRLAGHGPRFFGQTSPSNDQN